MPKHYSEDYKITAVKHYINKSKNLSKTCKIFECSRISLDESSIQPAMLPEYSRCPLEEDIVKTNDTYFYRKFTLLCAVNN